MSPTKLAAVDRRAADAGLDRTNYLLRLVDDALAKKKAPMPKRRFNSMHLLGKFHSSGSTNTNVRVAVKPSGEQDR
jgi:hypothetical protein